MWKKLYASLSKFYVPFELYEYPAETEEVVQAIWLLQVIMQWGV